MKTRYETPQEQMERLKLDAAKFAKGHAQLIERTQDNHKIRTSKRLFSTKIYNERLPPALYDEIVELFDDLVDQELELRLHDLHQNG